MSDKLNNPPGIKICGAAEAVVAPTERDPMEYVSFLLKRDPRSKENGKFVSVNQMTYFIPYGKRVTIPRCIAEVLENTEMEDARTYERLLAMQEEAMDEPM